MRHLRAFVLIAMVALSASASAQEPRIYLFWGGSCPYSQGALSFLRQEREGDPNIELVELETEGTLVHAVLLAKLFQMIGLPDIAMIPTVVIGSSITVGYDDDATTGQEINGTLAACRKERCPDLIGRLSQELDQPDQASATAKAPVKCSALPQFTTHR